MTNPRFSIIVPIYNIDEYLAVCVDSILAQSFKNYELILVDDGSPDNCNEICDNYARQYENVKVIHKQNGGLVSARKAGSNAASGEYIINIDGDDYIESNLLKVVDDAIGNQNPDVVAYGFKKVSENKVLAIDKFHDPGLYTGESLTLLCHRYLYDSSQSFINGGYIPHCIWGKAVKRNLYKYCQKLIPNNITKGEDTLFTMALLKNCSSIYLSDCCVYNYRDRPNSMINALNSDDFMRLKTIANVLQEIVGDNSEYDNQISVYILRRVLTLLGTAAKKLSRDKYYKYAKYIDDEIDLFLNRKIYLSKPTNSEKVQIFLVRKHCWAAYYYLKHR